MLNIIFAMLHNTKTDRYHYIMFYESQLPGQDYDDKPVRHRSMGHHTEGHDTREEAVKYVERQAVEMEPKPRLCLNKDFPWDGEGIPAMVVYFSKDEKQVPLMKSQLS